MLPKQRSRRESFTKFGGQFSSWDPSGKVVYTLGKTLFRYDITTAEAVEKAQKEEAKEKEKVEKDIASAETEEGNDDEKEKDKIEDYQAKELDVTVKANRAIAKGLLALTNATILTMDGEEIIERGTVLIQNNRIQKK